MRFELLGCQAWTPSTLPPPSGREKESGSGREGKGEGVEFCKMMWSCWSDDEEERGPFGVPRAERIRGEGDSGHLGAALHDCLPHDHQSPCRQLRRHRSSR
ncbi:uncharacterized protein LOC135096699 [Scylla paramamosain]|uniref:uncharacterized protein LOC135096699 n=1 Tax=Scylla paramamosain TaxID=85552 RepID=UPI003082C147